MKDWHCLQQNSMQKRLAEATVGTFYVAIVERFALSVPDASNVATDVFALIRKL